MNRLLYLFSFLPLALSAQMADFREADLSVDGPYLVYEDDKFVARWAWPESRQAGEAVWVDTDPSELPPFPAFRPTSVDPDRTFKRDPQVTFSGVEKIAALSDIHGQYEVAKKLLQEHDIMDANLDWIYGTGHLVIVGDIFDRGDQVNAILWMIYNLQQQAAAAGGRVHFLLGNHETMIMEGDIRYINKRYLTTTALLQKPYQNLYGPDTYLGRWLRSLPLTVRINDLVFVHGGFSKAMLREISSLEKINDTYHRNLIDVETVAATASDRKLDLLHGRDGPLWYRGYFMERDFEKKDIERILKRLKANRLVVGHTSFDAIKSYFDGKVLAVDSSIKFGSTGEVLLIEDGTYWRGDLLGKRRKLLD